MFFYFGFFGICVKWMRRRFHLFGDEYWISCRRIQLKLSGEKKKKKGGKKKKESLALLLAVTGESTNGSNQKNRFWKSMTESPPALHYHNESMQSAWFDNNYRYFMLKNAVRVLSLDVTNSNRTECLKLFF